MSTRDTIVRDFAEWAAMSAARSGVGHPKSRDVLYPLLRLPDYDTILVGDSPVSQHDFDAWHKRNVLHLTEANDELCVGWAAKLLNIYLKTRVYLAGQGRPKLVEFIHPPIDSGLWQGIKEEYGNDKAIWRKVKQMKPIQAIINYTTYEEVIEGCRLVAKLRQILLVEVDELWRGTEVS